MGYPSHEAFGDISTLICMVYTAFVMSRLTFCSSLIIEIYRYFNLSTA